MRKAIIFIVLFIFVLFSQLTVAQENEGINWIHSYDKALKIASEKDKNIFIFVTAPTWCSPCRWMEANVFTNEIVTEVINEYFVPVKLLDSVNGKPNPELERFDIDGFPTMLIYSKEGNYLNDEIGSLYSSELLEFLSNYDS
jgi:thioredoxin-related protein